MCHKILIWISLLHLIHSKRTEDLFSFLSALVWMNLTRASNSKSKHWKVKTKCYFASKMLHHLTMKKLHSNSEKSENNWNLHLNLMTFFTFIFRFRNVGGHIRTGIERHASRLQMHKEASEVKAVQGFVPKKPFGAIPIPLKLRIKADTRPSLDVSTKVLFQITAFSLD